MSKTPQEIDRINALFAEHVMGWMAVGKRRRGVSGALHDEDVWMGVPRRDDILRDVPNYWHDLKTAWSGLLKLSSDEENIETTIINKGDLWSCRIERNERNGRACTAFGKQVSHAIVRSLLMYFKHPLVEAGENDATTS